MNQYDNIYMIIKQDRNLFLVVDMSEIMILSYKLRLFQYYPCLYCIDVKFKGRIYIPKLNPLISSHSYFTLLPTVFQYFRGWWCLDVVFGFLHDHIISRSRSIIDLGVASLTGNVSGIFQPVLTGQ